MLSDSPCLQGLRRWGGTGVPLLRELGKALEQGFVKTSDFEEGRPGSALAGLGKGG